MIELQGIIDGLVRAGQVCQTQIDTAYNGDVPMWQECKARIDAAVEYMKGHDELQSLCDHYGLTRAGVAYALCQYQQIVTELTNGRFSKLTYPAQLIIDTATECFEKDAEPASPGRWISVDDATPDKDGEYLTWHGQSPMVQVLGLTGADLIGISTWIAQKGGWWSVEMNHPIIGITYWQPLPEPPKEDDE